jgi:hypothetical protein
MSPAAGNSLAQLRAKTDRDLAILVRRELNRSLVFANAARCRDAERSLATAKTLLALTEISGNARALLEQEMDQIRQALPSTDAAHLFVPKDTYRFGGGFRFGGGGRGGTPIGENPAGGALVYYSLKSLPQGEVTLEFLDSAGKLVNKFFSRAPEQAQGSSEEGEENPFRGAPPARLAAAPGLNRFAWNLRYPDATSFPGMIMWAGSVTGPQVSPGKFQVRLTVDGKAQTESLEVKKDPRLETTPEDYAKQLALSLQIRDKLSATNDAVVKIREIRKQLDDYSKRDNKKIADAAKDLVKRMTAVEEDLYQTKNRASEDPLNFPIKLNNKLAHVLSVVQSSDHQPTAQSYMVYEDLATAVNGELNTLDKLLTTDLAAFNKLIHDENVPAVQAPVKK